MYKVPDAVPPIHVISSHVATDKGPSKLQSIFSDNLWPIATRGKKARGMLLVDIGCSSKRAPLSISYYNEISGGHIGSCRCLEEGSASPVLPLCFQQSSPDNAFWKLFYAFYPSASYVGTRGIGLSRHASVHPSAQKNGQESVFHLYISWKNGGIFIWPITTYQYQVHITLRTLRSPS